MSTLVEVTDGLAEPSPSPAIERSLLQAVLVRAAHPVLLAAVVLTVTATLRLGLDPGAVSVIFLVTVIAYLAILEQLIPHDPTWLPSRRDWGWYGVYFLLTTLAGGLAQLPVLALVGAVAAPDPHLPLWAETPVALLLSSLGSYVVHRAGHANRWLWRVHGVHHVPDKVNVGNNGVNHVLDVVLAQATVQLALALAGFSAEAVFTVGVFVIAQGYFIHANIAVRLGRLNYVLAGPEQHRLHHSRDLAEAGHYGSEIPLWDLLFGTFTWRPGRRPAAVGLVKPDSFPPVEALVATLLQPWRRPRRSGTS